MAQLKRGVFTLEFLLDLVVYGIVFAICTICTFIAVMFGIWDGDFGENCNIEWGPTCEGVFRARASCYTVFTWTFLYFAWVLCDARRSFFDGMIHETAAWFQRLWHNQLLFWSVVGGVIVIIPTMYIPTLNTYVFLHKGIGLEWAVVFSAFIFFVGSCEAWKWAKRVYLRRHNLIQRKGEEEEMGEADFGWRVFGSS
jgi:magnesium-transporting ATPase (P-type)